VKRALARPVGVFVLTLGATVGVLGLASGVSVAADAPPAGPTTAPVTRTTLESSKELRGSIGYGASTPLLAAATGTLTWLPRPGDVIGLDGVLYRVDEKEVRAMHGDVPVFRNLERGAEGADVTQLKSNLRELGYEVDEDDTFDWQTQQAVKKWQKDRGREQTGWLGASDIMFVPTDLRVDEVSATVGEASGDLPYTTTSPHPLVTTVLEGADASAAPAVGDPLTVIIDGAERAGTVSGVSRTEEGETLVEVMVDGEPPSPMARIVVVLPGESRPDVLAVPVPAILAGADGYLVTVVADDGTTTDVPVEVGLVAGADVQVISSALAEGDQVEVPS